MATPKAGPRTRFVFYDEVEKNAWTAAPQCGKGKDAYPCPLLCIAGLHDTDKEFLIIHVLLPHWGAALPEMLFYEVIRIDETAKSAPFMCIQK